MLLTPTERDRVLLFSVAQLARARRARGLRLNVPEAIAIVADTVCEAARDGLRHHEALAAGRAVLGVDDVLDGVPETVTEVRVEAVFDDGSRLVVVTDPFGALARAQVRGDAPADRADETAAQGLVPDAVPPLAGPAAPSPVRVTVVNTAAVAVSVSSHFHFFEANPRLRFDRGAAYGRHLRVPAGSTVRFDPGVPLEVDLVPFGGARVIIGFSGLVDGPLDAPGAREAALERARACGYLDDGPADGPPAPATDEETAR